MAFSSSINPHESLYSIQSTQKISSRLNSTSTLVALSVDFREQSMADPESSSVPFLRGQMGDHQKRNERPKEPWKGEFAKSIVYAGLDAIVTSFSLISSISAGRLSSVDVLVLGIANLVADGISMGFGDYMSTSTEKDLAASQRSLTEWDVENHRRLQKQELLHRYQELGMDTNDAKTVVDIFSKYRDMLVGEKMTTEKGMLPPDPTEKPWKNGLVTFVAFILFGSAPILSYIILIPFTDNQNIKFIGACILSALALALLGIAKAKIAGQRYWVSAGITVFNGAIAGAAAYAIGWTLKNVAGLEE